MNVKHRAVIPAVLNCILPFLTSAEGKEGGPLNIVFFLADDLGYSDVGYMGQKPEIETPSIDKLAKSGTVFTSAYAACPVCSPTRASILTGKYPATLHLTCHIPGIGMKEYITQKNNGKKLMEADFIDRLPLDETTFAEVLRKEGYKTAFVGKWHLAGEGSQKTNDGIVDARFHPDKQGFDVNIGGCAYGQPASYFSPYKNGEITDGPENEYLTDRLGDEAVRFIEENKEKPFLLYLSFYTVHTPLKAPGETVRKFNGNTYYAMINKLDDNIGKVLDKLDELGLAGNTLCVFYSDNGGVKANPPLKSNKGSLYEGGIRVPLIFSMPGTIPSGVRCDAPVTSPDFFPTLINAAGLSPEKYSSGVEGINLWPAIRGKANFPQRAIYWHFPHHRDVEQSMAAAIREGDWKLIWQFETDKLCLFNLKKDIGEKEDLSEKYPQKVNDLYSKLKDWLRHSKAVMPKPNPV